MNLKNMTSAKEIPLRRLGGLECYHLMLQDFLHTNVVVHARITGPLPEETLRRALDLLQQRHPLMQARIRRRRRGTFFMSGVVPPIPLRVIVTDEKNLRAEAEEELNTPLPIETGPLVRCALLRHDDDSSTVLITYSHTIGDGLSGAYMIRDLLRFTADTPSPDIQPLPLKLRMERYFPPGTRGLHGALAYASVNGRYMNELKTAGGSVTPEYDGQAPLHLRRMQIVTRNLEPTILERLSVRARTERTTINSALVAAHLMAFARDRGDGLSIPVALMSAVNLRDRLIPPAGEEINNFAGSCNTVHRVSPDGDFWALAREHRELLLRGISSNEPMLHLLGLNLYDFLVRWIGHDNFAARALDNFYSRFRQKMTIVSNMGNLDMQLPGTGLKVESMGFASSSRASGMIYSIIATAGRRLTWNFTGTAPLYSRDHLERIADSALAILRASLEH